MDRSSQLAINEREPAENVEAVPRSLDQAARRSDRRGQYLARLQALSAVLAGARTQTETAGIIARELVATLAAQRCAVLLTGVNDAELVLVGGSGPRGEPMGRQRVTLPARGALVDALRTGGPAFVTLAEHTIEVVLPLQLAGHSRGLLDVAFVEPRAFTNEDLAFATTVANLGAQAFERVSWQETERRLEAQLDAERARLEAVVRNLPSGVIIAEAPSGKVVLQNTRAEGFFTPPAGDESGRRSRAYHRDGRLYEADEDPLRRSLSGEMVTDEEIEWVRGDGSRCFVRSNAVPVRDREGTIRTVVVTFTDMTREKEALADRERLLVCEQVARAEAEAATRAKDEFLAVLSHELRTPLQSILGWVQLLRRRNLDERSVAKGLETIERNTKVQAQLIEDLLDISRIVAGKVRIERCPTNLIQLIEASIESIKAAAIPKGVRVESILQLSVANVVGDPDRLQQVFANLLSNAVKFTPQGGRVGVRLDDDGGDARITVSDTGVGIPAEFLPHIFGRFQQADGGRARGHGGLGLGLTIVRHLVELHGGTVCAESPGPGQGATFTVTLPLGRREVDSSSRLELSTAPLPDALSGVRVLVVEDEADTRALFRKVLEEWGAEVTAVSSVTEALTAFAARRPDVIMSDIGMPGEDGYQFIRKVRSFDPSRGGTVPAVAVTAYAGVGDRQSVLAAGFQAHVAKPVRPGDLAKTIAELAGRSVG